MRVNRPPSSIPGTFVGVAPMILRNSDGADILGSKVSMWVGPPPSHSHTTDVLRVGRPAAVAWARPDGVVLLSPAAPSFDRYRDYRDRSAAFAAAVRSLLRE